jgi:hypothetical protein
MSGCSALDSGLLALRRQFGPGPPPAAPAAPRAVSDIPGCGFPTVRRAPPLERYDVKIGPVVVRGLLRPRPAWWYEEAGVLARRLRAGDDRTRTRPQARALAAEALANGPRTVSAQDFLLDVPAGTTVVISVPELQPDARLTLDSTFRVAGYVPRDGLPRLRCAADAPTAFHLRLIVAGARCVPITVRRDFEITTERIPFGVRRCS